MSRQQAERLMAKVAKEPWSQDTCRKKITSSQKPTDEFWRDAINWATNECKNADAMHKKYVAQCMARLQIAWMELKGPLTFVLHKGEEDVNEDSDTSALFAQG